MNRIKLFENFSQEEFELDKIYESWKYKNGNDLRMIIEQLENDGAEEEREKEKDEEGYDWLSDGALSAGEERALARDMQLLNKSQLAALYLKAKGKYDSEERGEEATREDRDVYVVGIPGMENFCNQNWKTGGFYITTPAFADAMGIQSLTTVTRTAKKFYQIISGIGATESEIIYDKLIKAYNYLRNQNINAIQQIASEGIQDAETSNVHRAAANERPRKGMNKEQRLAIGKRIYSLFSDLKRNPIFQETSKAQRSAISRMNRETQISNDLLKEIYKEYLIQNKLLNKFNWAS